MKKLMLACLCTLFTLLQITEGNAQKVSLKDNAWQTLSLVTFDRKFDEMLGMDIEIPNFSPAIKKLEGKEVVLQGYILPLEGRRTQKYFIFSAYPYNMCFFCGGAGPESVVESYCKTPIKYTTKMITIKGKLTLNKTGSMENMLYMLNDVELVE